MRAPPPIVLASGSPRRAEILRMLGLEFRVRPARIPEEARPGEGPEDYVERLARQKAVAVAGGERDALVVAGDTVVVLDGEVVEKPRDDEEAVEILLGLSGRAHRVVTGLAVAAAGGRVHSGVASTEVRFRPLGEEEVRAYVATGEPRDKAGAYGIQGRGASLVTGITGDYFTVVGLPVSLLVDLLERTGHPYEIGPPPGSAGRAGA